MRAYRGAAAVAAAMGLMLGPAAGVGQAEDGGGSRLALATVLRNCAHQDLGSHAPSGNGWALATVRSDGRTVTADVELAVGQRNTTYQVRLIQLPRPASAPCEPGDPGVTGGVLVTDFAGTGRTTVTGALMPGATGAWVKIELPSPYSQVPSEYYTSDGVAPV
ncbi:hypothetical protein [uncultured Mycolicibacterium sp.]|uniref:hypothetical protein n=1 Tax=uncultured Mycolicibacterium sp. TaxID=2320817 RepID=UPI0026218338|nr:hypothetical protein [uncultured Mycolicibacterium sp.]